MPTQLGAQCGFTRGGVAWPARHDEIRPMKYVPLQSAPTRSGPVASEPTASSVPKASAMRWMLAGLLGLPLAGCVYYPDHGYVRGDGYGASGAVYYESAPYHDGYYDGYYSDYYRPYGYSPYYWPSYYSIGLDYYDGHQDWRHGGHRWGDHGDRGHDARPAHRGAPEVQSRRRR